MEKTVNISALINLLDDPDEHVYTHVREQLMSFGTTVIPRLEGAWTHHDYGQLFQSRVEQLIHDIQLGIVSDSLSEWASAGGTSLLQGMLCLNRYSHPEADETAVVRVLEQIQQAIWLELNSNLTALEQVMVINHILFDVFGFTGNTQDYYNPQNSFITDVIEFRTGNPLSLGVIYSIVAQNLELPVYGVNLPQHFILAYVDRLSLYQCNDFQKADILFYVKPFDRGNVSARAEIDHFLEKLKLPKTEEFYHPCDNIGIVRRAIKNLENSYSRLGLTDKSRDMLLLLDCLG